MHFVGFMAGNICGLFAGSCAFGHLERIRRTVFSSHLVAVVLNTYFPIRASQMLSEICFKNYSLMEARYSDS